MVLEVRVAPEVDATLFADRQLVAVVVEDQYFAQQSRAHRARVGQPVHRVGVRQTVALGAGVVLVQHRAPPLDHPPLDVDRTGRSSVDRRNERRQVVGGPYLVGQLQHPDEHGRYPLAPSDAVVLDGRQCPLGVESLHDHHGAPQPVGT